MREFQDIFSIDSLSAAMMFNFFRTSGVEPCGHLAAAEAAIQRKQLHLEISEPRRRELKTCCLLLGLFCFVCVCLMFVL